MRCFAGHLHRSELERPDHPFYFHALIMITLPFPERLVALRKERKLSQQKLADAIGVHVTQLRRYEAGTSQPTLEVVRNLARALRVSADALVFDPEERGPDDEFRLHFEALSQLDDDERNVIKSVLDGLLLKHEAKRWTAPRGTPRRAAGNTT